jgi:pimeloyl-ACP methyl ester carboxylesterase
MAIAIVVVVMVVSACGGTSGDDGPRTKPSASTASPRTFDVGDHRLFAKCGGSGGPTVVFLHGLGGEGRDWAVTANHLKDAHTCWYDRLGVGLSDQDTTRHSALDSVEDLHELLPKTGAKPPYVLVGHSYGGMLALMYAGQHPDDVAGLVLADSTLPFEPELDPPGTVDDVKAEMDANQENLDAYEGYATAQRLEASLPPVPIIVMNGRLTELPDEWSKAAYERKLRAWVQGLDEGSLFDCDCDHDMPSDVPEIVAQKIRDVISKEES